MKTGVFAKNILLWITGVVENKTEMLKVECDRWNESASILRVLP
ncbi:hypothetical protein COO91_10297 (plasmid) [Nostoc flagelliforme CCNUN1]|uniref:Uncharacterized protein n=1 Tax=Nostoc flagelliforme CCNUN1 TaxID=2038116 RepID=A0A2K8SFX5_9NOSO|nr:hypothetical protein COO91_00184 [Nostoc flagelliforme CCNUN1]AUB38131.1 hypothetical protein COO91_04094 [Nostoc flagelliforme CCNUN1]AUB44079.1 hypothetical protein COO91_10297 [Nostoc flagelliforme CCNUN1]